MISMFLEHFEFFYTVSNFKHFELTTLINQFAADVLIVVM